MNAYLNYALEANLGLTLFLGLYFLLFRNENDFAAKRYYLLGSLGISLVIPFLHIPSSTGYLIPSVGNSAISNWLPEVTIWSGTASSQSFSVWQWALIVYISITGVLLVRMIWKLLSLYLFIRNSADKMVGKFHLIETSHDLTAFSFFNFIVLGNGPFSNEERNLIIKHESIHAERMHSLDVLLLQSLVVLFWYNPCVYFYRNILCEIHEFEADSLTLPDSQSSVYTRLLAQTALGKVHFPLANHLNKSITLKRLTMLHSFQKKINSWKWFASGFTALALFLVVACQDQVKSTSDEKSGVKDDMVYTVVEEVATPADGITAYYDFIAQHLKYPEQARKMGIEGKVYVEFVVKKDGSISELKVLKGIGAGCDAEAMNVLTTAPKWNPGKQRGEPVSMRFVLPIIFKLGDGTTSSSDNVKNNPLEFVGDALSCSMVATTRDGKTIVEGKLTDKSGNPVPGVNIVLKNSSHGTVSSQEGTFHFETEEKTGSLVMSHVSFKPVEKEFGEGK